MPRFSIEEIIRQAMQEGKFDDLPGKGKPLNLDQNPYEDPEWRVAHHLLKSGGYSLPWIEHLSEIHNNLQQARQALERARDWRQREIARISSDEIDLGVWLAAVEQFKDQAHKVNDQIRSYNLEVPNSSFQIPLVEIDQEMEQVMKKGIPGGRVAFLGGI
jgi:DnaJ family protein C protein 28